ncbi:MAG TPA: outer membrane beta-barrel protein [Bacteroidales bacterium]|nr:outer membrane beta-barrel protein [Bacteroidales bacterium]
MKKYLLTLFLSTSIAIIANAQFTKLGGGLGFTSGYYFHEMKYDYNKSGHFPVSLKGIYEISLPFHISPTLSFFVPHVLKEQDSKYIVNTMMFDINGHYVFNSLDQFEFYGLAGLDIMLAWKKEKYLEEVYKEKDNALGLNIGIGTYMKITDMIDLYAEGKYLWNNKYNQLMLNAGILFNIEWMKKNDKQGI